MNWKCYGLVLIASLPLRARAEAIPAERLSGLRDRVISLEQHLIVGLKEQKQARGNVKRIQTLLKLQQEEFKLGRQRTTQLEQTIAELETRRGALKSKILEQQRSIRSFLAQINRSLREDPSTLHLYERERFEAPRRKVLARLVDRGIKEIETLRVDLTDADQLEARIQEEKGQLAYLFQDLKEQEGILELNRQIQIDLIQKKHEERISQLENYRKLKTSEMQVEKLIGEFNSRKELEQTLETERVASKAMIQGAFSSLKGKLSLPLAGKVVSFFGRSFDPKSNLNVFKKGVDITTSPKQVVHAISAGKVAFSGELPNYGRVAIVDHGDHFYSLCAHLGELNKQVGDPVAAGDPIGISDDAGTPVYFEIRARNIAVNPLQWVSIASTL